MLKVDEGKVVLCGEARTLIAELGISVYAIMKASSEQISTNCVEKLIRKIVDDAINDYKQDNPEQKENNDLKKILQDMIEKL